MKKFIITAIILLAIWVFAMATVKAQTINPYVGVEYFTDYNYTYTQEVIDVPLLPVEQSVYNNKPNALTIYLMAGFELKILKNLLADMRVETLTSRINGLKFQPLQTDYTFALKYKISRITIKYEHKCIHPTKSMIYHRFEMYGGYDKIGVYWQLNPKSKF